MMTRNLGPRCQTTPPCFSRSSLWRNNMKTNNWDREVGKTAIPQFPLQGTWLPLWAVGVRCWRSRDPPTASIRLIWCPTCPTMSWRPRYKNKPNLRRVVPSSRLRWGSSCVSEPYSMRGCWCIRRNFSLICDIIFLLINHIISLLEEGEDLRRGIQ